MEYVRESVPAMATYGPRSYGVTTRANAAQGILGPNHARAHRKQPKSPFETERVSPLDEI